jgi:hypothetical protein
MQLKTRVLDDFVTLTQIKINLRNCYSINKILKLINCMLLKMANVSKAKRNSFSQAVNSQLISDLITTFIS